MDHGGNGRNGFELEIICNGWNWMKKDENWGFLKNALRMLRNLSGSWILDMTIRINIKEDHWSTHTFSGYMRVTLDEFE